MATGCTLFDSRFTNPPWCSITPYRKRRASNPRAWLASLWFKKNACADCHHRPTTGLILIVAGYGQQAAPIVQPLRHREALELSRTSRHRFGPIPGISACSACAFGPRVSLPEEIEHARHHSADAIRGPLEVFLLTLQPLDSAFAVSAIHSQY